MTVKEWREEGRRRFGPDEMKWRFVCPSCGHVASIQDWKDAGAEETTVAFSCIGRWLDSPERPKELFGKPGPCNYAGGGLLRLNPVEVTCEDGTVINLFDFAESESEACLLQTKTEKK